MNPETTPAPEKPWWRTLTGTPPGNRKLHRIFSSRFIGWLGVVLQVFVMVSLLGSFDSWRHRLLVLTMMSWAYILGIRWALRS